MKLSTLRVSDCSYSLAAALVAAVHQHARSLDVRVTAAVVDRGGVLVASGRMDGCILVAIELAIDKAFTALSCAVPTEALRHTTQPGGSDWGFPSTLGGRMVVFGGGFPIVADSELIGGLGVSGATVEQDVLCGRAALAEVQASAPVHSPSVD